MNYKFLPFWVKYCFFKTRLNASPMVEQVFGRVTPWVCSFFSLRGRTRVNSQRQMHCLVYNVKKIHGRDNDRGNEMKL